MAVNLVKICHKSRKKPLNPNHRQPHDVSFTSIFHIAFNIIMILTFQEHTTHKVESWVGNGYKIRYWTNIRKIVKRKWFTRNWWSIWIWHSTPTCCLLFRSLIHLDIGIVYKMAIKKGSYRLPHAVMFL